MSVGPIQRDRNRAGDSGCRSCSPCYCGGIRAGSGSTGFDSRVWQKMAGTRFDDLPTA